MKKFGMFAASAAILLFTGIAAHGYEAIEVKTGTTLKGVVALKGEAPPDETITVTKDTEVCGATQKRGKYLVHNGRVKNAVVWIEGIQKGKPVRTDPVNITIKNCAASPHVSVGFVGGKFVFTNEDEVMHTMQLKLGLEYQSKASARPVKDGATIYNLALPNKGVSIVKPIKAYHRYTEDTGFIQIKSNTHECISGYVYVFDQPYATVTDDQGSFVIDGLPAGAYTLAVWHEGFGKETKQITVSSGEVADVQIELP